MTESRRIGSSIVHGSEVGSFPADVVAARSKAASPTVYIQEEVSDARMRCDQLLRYVAKATKLIEKSKHKDHFFEVAGDLIRGIPETSFKLHKALQAVALAVNRIDYDELKQDLRPEKVDELERVLKDVRVRQVHRRSIPMLKPASVVDQLRGLAKKAKDQGGLDTEGLATLIASLEAGAPRKAEDAGARIAAQLEAIAHALEHPPDGEMPSRLRLAQVLRATLGTHAEVAPDESRLRRAKEGGSYTPAAHAKHELLLAALELKKAGERLGGDPRATRLRIGEALASLYRSLKTMRQPDEIGDAISHAGAVLRRAWDLEAQIPAEFSKDAADDERRSRFEEGKPADPTEDMSEVDAKTWKENTEEHKDDFKKEAGKPPEDAASEITAAIESLKKLVRGSGNPKRLLVGVLSSLSLAVKGMGQDEKISNLLDRTAAAVQANWSSKGLKEIEATDNDAMEKTAFVSPEPQNPEEVTRVLAQIMDAARKASNFDGDYKRVLFQAVRVVNGLYGLGLQFDVPSISLLVRIQKELMKFAGVHPATTYASFDDEKFSRHEEGKPTDPTKNMDPEDAKKWKENTEEFGDKFKKEAHSEEQWELANEIITKGVNHPAFNAITGAWKDVEDALKECKTRSDGMQRAGAGRTEDPTFVMSTLTPALREYADVVNVVANQMDKKVGTGALRFGASRKEAVKLTEDALLDVSTAIFGLKQVARGSGSAKRTLANIVMSLSRLSTHLGQDEKIARALDLAARSIIRSFSTKDMRDYEETPVMASEDERRSRHEEGKSVDPTKNMDPEDAKTWKENTEEHKDKFKKEARAIPPAPGNVVDEIMSWHGGQGTNLYSVGSMWNAGKSVDADSAEEAYDELDRHRADDEVLQDFKDHLRQYGVRVSSQGKVAGLDPNDLGDLPIRKVGAGGALWKAD